MFRVIDDDLILRILQKKPGCKRLSLSRNAIERVSHVNIFQRLTFLTVLDLSYNRLSQLGDEFEALPNLTHLNVSSNNM